MKNIAGRTLHLIDIENLAGTALPAADEIRACRAEYEAAFVKAGDLVVIACSHAAFPVVGWEWPHGRHLVRSGPDGADLALVGVLDHERVSDRFSSVVIGSGDGIFASEAARLASLGVDVTVVSQPRSLARRLRMAAHHVEMFTGPAWAMVEPLESA